MVAEVAVTAAEAAVMAAEVAVMAEEAERWRDASEAAACIRRAWRQMEQTELVGGRRTDQNALEVGGAVGVSEHVASR
jgi:hypothetical protein